MELVEQVRMGSLHCGTLTTVALWDPNNNCSVVDESPFVGSRPKLEDGAKVSSILVQEPYAKRGSGRGLRR